MLKKKFTLEFDEMPKLIFVSKNGKGQEDVLYINGLKVTGEKAVRIFSSFDDFTTYEVDYVAVGVGSGEESN